MKELIEKISRLPTWLIFTVVASSWAGVFLAVPFIDVLGIFIILWYFSIGYELKTRFPADTKLSFGWFVFTLIYANVYLLWFDYYFTMMTAGNPLLYMGPHLFAMYGLVYGYYFISKGLVSIEEGESPKFTKYLGTIILLWFFPIGVWFVVPRIRQQLITGR